MLIISFLPTEELVNHIKLRLMNYFLFFKHSFLIYKMNITLSTIAYLCIIGAVSYLGGLNDGEVGPIIFPSLFLYVADYSYVVGVVIIDLYSWLATGLALPQILHLESQ